MQGLFITFEGIEGAGKSTQARLLSDYLTHKGYPVVLTREPGGTKIGNTIRNILIDYKNTEMLPLTEVLLLSAARYQHVNQLIRPSLEEGKIVICDRFADATVTYQGYGRGVPMDIIRQLNTMATWGVWPHITVFIDIDLRLALNRLKIRNQETETLPDRFEREAEQFFEKVRRGYIDLANDEPARFRVFDGSQDAESIHQKIVEVISHEISRTTSLNRLPRV
jgi:dTMP kinase